MRLILVPALAILLPACRSTLPRYLITTAPVDTGAISQTLCIAVDPSGPHGIWWWEPGRSGCSSRSTGPDVFATERATVVRTRSGAVDGRFRLYLIVGPGSTTPDFADVAFVVDNRGLRVPASGARVAVQRQKHLNIRDAPR